MSRIEVILKATDVLNTLSIIDIQELLPYQSKLEDALQVLQRSVEAARAIQRESLQPGSSSLISSSTTLPSAPRSPRLLAEPDTASGDSECGSPIVSCSDRPTSHVTADALPKQNGNGQSGAEKLLLYLEDEKRSKKIREFLSSSDCDPIDGSGLLDWTEEDPRVIDLRLGSSPSSSFGVKFRRGLSQRSLAAEYNQWEKETYNTSRVTELSQDPATSADHNGHIEDFLQVNAHRFKDQDSTCHGIKHGIRLLVFESICGYAGVSAILMLVYSKFRSVKYEEHLTMKGLLENTEWESLARDKSSWLVRCQERYDEKNRMWAKHQAIWRATYGKMKRQRTAGIISSDRQLSSSHRRRLSGTTTAEEDNARERCFEEPRTSPSEMGSDMTPFPQIMESSPEPGNNLFVSPLPSSPSQGRSRSFTSSLSDPSPSSHGNMVPPRKRRRKEVPKPGPSEVTHPRPNSTPATEPISESGFSIRRGLPAEFSDCHRAAGPLSLRNYAQAFDRPIRPAGGNLTSENALCEPNNVQPGFHGRYAWHGLDDQNYARAFDHPSQPAARSPICENTLREAESGSLGGRFAGHGLDDQNYARAFDRPFQPAAEGSISHDAFREADNVRPGFHDRYTCHELNDHNHARAFDYPIGFTPTPKDPCHETGGLGFTVDSLEHQSSNNRSPRFGPGGIRETTEPAIHRALNEHCQRIADEIWSYRDIAQSFGPDTIQLIGEPHTAPLVA